MSDLFMKRGAPYSSCGTLRWTLTREWGEGPTCCYIGHNPSDAGHEIDDPTSRAWVHFAKAQGFGRYEAVNLYPFRNPDPKVCRRWARWDESGDYAARDALMRNQEVVARAACYAAVVVACWGALAEDSVWVEQIIEAVQGARSPSPDIYCLGTTLAGDPKHPMARGKHRIARDHRFTIWRKAA